MNEVIEPEVIPKCRHIFGAYICDKELGHTDSHGVRGSEWDNTEVKPKKDRKRLFHNVFHKKKALEDTPKERRKQFMRTRYTKPKCSLGGCANKAIYYIPRKVGMRWCREHLPAELAERLTCEWQYKVCIVPYARFMDNSGGR